MKRCRSFAAILMLIGSSCSLLHLTPSTKIQSLNFADNEPRQAYQFIYQNTENSPELAEIISTYRLDTIAKKGKTELEQILYLLDWTHSRWKHSGSNQPSNSKTLTILQEAEAGKKFRCVEYGIVLKSVLAANGFKARTLGLKTKDVEITRVGAGHVLTEAWSADHNKWFVLDPQFNIIPILEDAPLNAVEFQNAIIEKKNFRLADVRGEVSEKRRKKYLNFIAPYLYYFDYRFDQREIVYDSLVKANNKATLMLVPLGAKKPVIFQRKFEMDYLEYTSSLADFYKQPE